MSAPPVLATTAPIVAIASGKGGVGKTWLAITLAQAFSQAKQRTLLFDGDLGLANVDIQLGLVPERDLVAVAQGRCRLKDAAMSYPTGGFDIVAGRSGSGSLANLPAWQLEGLLRELHAAARDYDRLVLDLGAGLDTTVRNLAAQAGICLVVATDEPTSLTDAYAFIKVSLAERPGADIRIVVNLASSRVAGESTYRTLARACQQFLNANPPLAGIIRRDSRVRDAIRAQTPLLNRYPTAEAAADVCELADRLLRAA